MKYVEITEKEAEKEYKFRQIKIAVYKIRTADYVMELVEEYSVTKPLDVAWSTELTLTGRLKKILAELPDEEYYIFKYYKEINL